MRTRKAHSKSRNGCVSCKLRRVKCDEQGPPCANCIIRKTSCEYKDSSKVGGRSPASPRPASSSGSSPKHKAAVTPSAPVSSITRNHIELELMHRWSTKTYKSLSGLPNDEDIIQNVVTKDALQFDWLMDGILALTALEVTMENGPSESGEYIRTALELFDRSLPSFRAELNNLRSENHLALYMYSSIAAIINVVIPECIPSDNPHSALDSISEVFEVFTGAGQVALMSWRWLADGPLPIDAVMPDNLLPKPLSKSDNDALVRLFSLNDSIHGGDNPPNPDISEQKIFKDAISHLEGCYARDDERVKGYCVAWLVLAGRHVMDAIRRCDPLALVILMHWAVLLDRFGKQVWYAERAGKKLIVEASEEIQRTDYASLPEWQVAMGWARQQVGLPALL